MQGQFYQELQEASAETSRFVYSPGVSNSAAGASSLLVTVLLTPLFYPEYCLPHLKLKM